MNLYYAMGGGLGHLTRARAFLYTLGLETESVILTASPFARDRRVMGHMNVVVIDKSFENDLTAFHEFLRNTFSELNIKTIYLDSFPVGIIGEFAEFNFRNIEINYVARLLRWKNYESLIKGNIQLFEKTFILEPLEEEHQKFINQFSNQQIDFELKYPFRGLSAEDKKIFETIKRQKPFWLIVHSGSENEILELVNYVDEMSEIEQNPANLILISPNKIDRDNLFQYNLYPASVLFNSAERIFTACGFNAMNQLKNLKDRHYFIPFERRFDNQFMRAKRLRMVTDNKSIR